MRWLGVDGGQKSKKRLWLQREGTAMMDNREGNRMHVQFRHKSSRASIQISRTGGRTMMR